MIRIDDLNQAVRSSLGRAYGAATVSCITRAFVEQVVQALVNDGEVQIPGLGTLRVHVVGIDRDVELVHGNFKKGGRTGKRKVRIAHNIRVHFSKSPILRNRLKEKHHVNGEVRSRRASD